MSKDQQWKSAIKGAIDRLDKDSWASKNNSTTYDFIYNGKGYPPKEIYRIAAEIFEDKNPNEIAPSLGGGFPTNEFLQQFGFEVRSKKSNHSKQFFSEEDFELLNECAGDKYNNEYPDMVEAYNKLKAVYDKVGYWAKEIKKNLFPNGKVKIVRKPTNQANFFEEYMWARIYPTEKDQKDSWLAYTVGIDSNFSFVIKMDTIHLKNEHKRRQAYLELSNNYNNPAIAKNLDFKEDKVSDWNALLETTTSFFKQLEPQYISFKNRFASMSNKQEENRNESRFPLNQILYGPPGTGKTYKTKELAVQIANPDLMIDADLDIIHIRKAITKEYDRLYDNGQIVFTTFHQSFSYEDFVEGIKPETLDNNVTYSVIPGIFKEICEKADTKDASNFEEILARFKEDVIEQEKITVNTGSIEFDVFYKGGKTFKINPKDSKVENPQYPASIENILKLYKNAPNENMYNPSYVKGILNFLFAEYGLKKYDSIDSQNNKKYVLIIDEINRGNVSAIFGELITLLEPDKRLGADEEIVLNLPYSKDETFGVPSNLYIIGTMNTADRSVEALDTALRRRFVFEEVMPKPELLDRILYDGFNLREVLETINNRIEALLDRDHTIGHSYFIKLKSGNTEGLSNVFKNNIIPLLQEYFYNDYEKIALVLGKGFVKEKNQKPVEFAQFDNIDTPEKDRAYELISEVEDIEEAVKLLLNSSNEQ